MRKIILTLFVAALMLTSNSAVYAQVDQSSVKAIHTETLNKFHQNTADLREQLKVKDLELRWLYSDEGLDTQRVSGLEEDIKGIKSKIKSVAASMNLEPCNCL
ncbi:MAG: hypothetical protein PHF56_07120 [Desulfuromonadaceae bacterium]|nr:hypothetical protein [Desulfuromonadaceae bacterium]